MLSRRSLLSMIPLPLLGFLPKKKEVWKPIYTPGLATQIPEPDIEVRSMDGKFFDMTFRNEDISRNCWITYSDLCREDYRQSVYPEHLIDSLVEQGFIVKHMKFLTSNGFGGSITDCSQEVTQRL